LENKQHSCYVMFIFEKAFDETDLLFFLKKRLMKEPKLIHEYKYCKMFRQTMHFLRFQN